MTHYISAEQLEAYRTRVLPTDELLRLDRLLAAYAERGEMLARDGDWKLADVQLQSIHRAATALPTPHLSYESLEGWVDGTLEADARGAADAHLRECPMCLTELRDFMEFAAPMVQPLPVADASPQRRPRVNRWAGPALAIAATVILGIGAVQWIMPGSPTALTSGTPADAAYSATRAVTHVNDFDYGVFDRLVLHTDGARAAYLKDDYSIMAAELADRADHDVQAASALGLIDVAGLASSANQQQELTQGIHLLTTAAQEGDAYAQYNLGVAYERGIGVPADEATAKRWYRTAAAQNLQSAKDAVRD